MWSMKSYALDHLPFKIIFPLKFLNFMILCIHIYFSLVFINLYMVYRYLYVILKFAAFTVNSCFLRASLLAVA